MLEPPADQVVVAAPSALSRAKKAQAHLGAGRDNSAYKDRCGGKLLLLPAELLVYWRLSTYQSLREKHICATAETTRTQLSHNSKRSQLLTGPTSHGRSHWSCPSPANCRATPENNEGLSRYLGCLGRHT